MFGSHGEWGVESRTVALALKDLFAAAGQLQQIQGIEGWLRRRRRNSVLTAAGTVLVGVIEVARELADSNEALLAYMERVGASSIRGLQALALNVWYLIVLEPQSLDSLPVDYGVLGFYLIGLGVVVYLVSRHTAFLLEESQEPFQYTFWIARFTRAEDADASGASVTENDPVHHHLHHDLMEMLNRRIGRFSLLDERHFEGGAAASETPPSHIHVDGHYSVRPRPSEDGSTWVVQVLPRVRIGPPGKASILTQPVEIEPGELPDGTDPYEATYDQVLDQVYSKVASEIYRQLKSDIESKLHLFPTSHLRARALYYEAEDFSRSNTIDSYDYAIELFERALRCYDLSGRVRLGFLGFGVRYELMHAKTKVEYAKSLIYRRLVSSYAGRTRNPLFAVPKEIRAVANRLIPIHNRFHRRKVVSARLEDDDQAVDPQIGKSNRHHLALSSLTYRKDGWEDRHLSRRSDTATFEECRKLLFEAYIVLALAYSDSQAFQRARLSLDEARATYPEKADTIPLFLLTQAEVQPNVEAKIPLLTQATDLAPTFEIPQYLLAQYSLQLFLLNGEIEEERARPVVAEFRKVLRINPGNIASYTQLGYLYWLVERLDLAQQQFEQGIQTKAIVQQTFVGELNYGLARVAARRGELNRCYDLYNEAQAAEPNLGAYMTDTTPEKPRAMAFNDYLTQPVLDRYEQFRNRFETQIQLAFLRV